MLRLLFPACVAAAVAGGQVQQFRPVSLADLVKAVGTNRDGLDDVDVTPIVADHALFVGEGMGIAARFRDDPGGAIFVGWRRPGALWTYRFIDEQALEKVRPGGEPDLHLGRVDGLRPVGPYFVLETRAPAAAVTSVVLQGDLAPVALARGSVKLALPDGQVIVQRATADRGAELALLAPASRAVVRFYSVRRGSISSPALDERADALTFLVTLIDAQPSIDGAPSAQTVRVTCRSISQPSRSCG